MKGKLGERSLRLIKDDKIIEALKPKNAIQILKTLLEFREWGEEANSAKIAKHLGISPSTVLRNVERLNFDAKLIETKQVGKQYLITFTTKGLKVAKLISNSEFIEEIEKKKDHNEKMIVENKGLIKLINARITIKKDRKKHLIEEKQDLLSRMEKLNYENNEDAVLESKRLNKKINVIDSEIDSINIFLRDKTEEKDILLSETRKLQYTIEEFSSLPIL